ncbi:lectin 2b [Suillus ampliporus]|nr:lectin 2b [Suillus ampliporus]
MSYTIAVRIVDASASDPGFKLVEKTVWHYANGGTWSNTDSIETLVMGGSGTSGSLRFRNGAGEEFLVTLGVHNYKRWCDVVTDLATGDTGMKIQPEYYMDSNPRNQMLWKQLADLQRKSAKGTSVEIKYVKEEGNTFVVHIDITS